MQLLSAEKVKSTENRKESERRERTRKANQEESEAVRRMNIALEEEGKTKARIARDHRVMEDEIGAKKKELLKEVGSLEERKREALKPVSDTLKRAEAIEKANKEERERLATRSEKLKKNEEKVVERMEAVSDREQLADERHTSLESRETGIIAAEAETRRSADELAEKWVAFHKTVHDQNETMERREKEVQDALKVIETRKARQDTREEEQNARDIQLKDRSATLERTAQELLQKQK